MKFSRKTKIIFLILVIIVGGLYIKNRYEKNKLEKKEKEQLMYSVQKGDIEVDVKVTAKSKLAKEQNLSFAREGKITKVNVVVGDEIMQGDVLAELDMDDYENTVETSRLELANAELGLEKLLNNDTSLREAQLETQISELKSNYEIELQQEKVLKEQLTLSLEQKKEQLEQLLRAYNLTKKNLEIIETSLISDIEVVKEKSDDAQVTRQQTITSTINSLKSSLGDVEKIIESVDKIFGISDEFKYINDNYENYIGAKNTLLKNKTRENIILSYKLIDKYTIIFNNMNSSMTDDQIFDIIENYYNESIILENLCDNALDTLDASIESSGNLTETMIEGFETTVNTSRTSAISTRSVLESLSNSVNLLLSDNYKDEQLNASIEQINLNYEEQKTNLENQQKNILLLAKEIESSEKDNINSLNRKKSQNEMLLEDINLLEKELKDVLDGPDEYDITSQQNLIKQAQLRLEKTIDQKDDYQIIAEFDGRVRSVDIVLGEQYELDDRKFIVVENPNLIELELEVNQIDIVKIKKGDIALVTFDAYPNKPIEASITTRSVNPEDNGRGGVYYKAKILLEKQDIEVLAGMSALVTIKTAESNDTIIIPVLSVFDKDNKKYVYLMDGENYIRHEVQTGIMNNFMIEVVDGLKVGDIIKSSVLDDDLLKEMGIDDSASIF